MTSVRGRKGYVTVDTEVTVDIWPEDLEAEGWHHEDDCEKSKGCAHADRADLDDALDSLHRQAGHGDFPVYVCTAEPCRSLYLVPAGQALQEIRRKVAS